MIQLCDQRPWREQQTLTNSAEIFTTWHFATSYGSWVVEEFTHLHSNFSVVDEEFVVLKLFRPGVSDGRKGVSSKGDQAVPSPDFTHTDK